MSLSSIPTCDGQPGFRASRTRPQWIFALLLLVGAIANNWSIGRASVGLDYLHFWAVGQTASASRSAIYSADSARRIPAEMTRALTPADRGTRYAEALAKRQQFEITATPFLYSLLGAITTGDYELDYTVFQIICLVSMVAGLILIAKTCNYSCLEAMLAAVAILLFTTAYFSDLGVGNVNQIQVGCIALYLVLIRRPSTPSRDALAGALLGLLCMFKPNLALIPGLLAVVWIIEGRFRTLATQATGGTIAAISSFIFSAIYFGSARIWIDWWHGLRRFMLEANPAVSAGNVSLARILYELTHWHCEMALLLLGCLAFAVCCWIGWRQRSKTPTDSDMPRFLSDARAVTIGCLIMLLSADLVWLHYLLLAIPTLILLLRPADCATQPCQPARRILTAVVFAAYSMPAFKLMSISENSAWSAGVLAGATLLLLVLVLIDTVKGGCVDPTSASGASCPAAHGFQE
ncbi:MAG: hypothetical protein IT444_13260 [Phycisphaeraceae bacterium]|nr:hypothetical protein [Phycisphaeraceae bacterium]